MNNLIYDINDSPKELKEYLLYGAQQMISVLAATLLICKLCGTNVAAGLVGAGAATITFLFITKFKAPLFFSNSGSTVGAVQMAFLASTNNYFYVVIGGLTICLMNLLVSFLIKKSGSQWLKSLLSPVVAGTIVVVIGLHLSTFCSIYVLKDGNYSLSYVLIALITMFTSIAVMYYGKGRISTLPLLIGALAGYIAAIILGEVNWEVFKTTPLFILPDFAFLNIDASVFEFGTFISVVIAFAAVNLANLSEHISDVIAVSNVVGTDISETVGYDKTMAGDGIADLVGCLIAGQPTTTYSESLSTIAISKVASTRVILVAAIFTMLLGFCGPFNAFINSMPSCIFAGLGLVAYGCIAYSGIRTLYSAELKPKNMLVFGCMATIGISGVSLRLGNSFALETIAFAMIVGLILNIILKDD